MSMAENVKRKCNEAEVSEDSKSTDCVSQNDESSKTPERPFIQKGDSEDEIELEFDNKKKLYVSKNLLSLASPVFKAMFSEKFAESKLDCIQLPGKSYKNFLEFLHCIHPAYMKKVDRSNYLRIVNIAEEYQVKSIVKKCKIRMKFVIEKDFDGNVRGSIVIDYEKQFKALKTCLTVLRTAHLFSYEDIVDHCIHYAGKYSSALYGEISESFGLFEDPSTMFPALHKSCKLLFKNLPADVRCEILSKRLFYFDSYNLLDEENS